MTQPNFSSKPAPKSRQQVLNARYGHPLPILLPNSTQSNKGKSKSLLSAFSSTTDIVVPQCKGVYDPLTRSVWVTDRDDMDILFRRGFFGKGTLSRSEPSWRERRVDLLKGGSSYAAEQMREKRRLERKQFKIDRAAAMLDAAKTAEAVLVTGQAPPAPGESSTSVEDDNLGDVERSSSPTPSSSTTAVDVSSLTAQTYLVRPTRPDANRNRGRNAFKRKPAHPKDASAKPNTVGSAAGPSGTADREGSAPVPAGGSHDQLQTEVDDEVEPLPEPDDLEEEMIEEMEHLQLSLEEAWFLSSALGVLKILDPDTNTYPSPSRVLPMFLTPTSSRTETSLRPALRPDDPFMVSYVAYHHFRTVGWVVKPGIKFAADWLLYRRGPVFSHSAFAVVLVPVYEDEAERGISPYGQEDWYEERTSWKWINTIMRVNSLVQKTVIMAYVTIPSLASFPASKRDGDGLRSAPLDMQDLLKRYTVREVVLSRFGPARRRD